MVTNWPRLTGHLVPVLAYPSVREAVAWLSEAFGVAPDGGAVVAEVHGHQQPPTPGALTQVVEIQVGDPRGGAR